MTALKTDAVGTEETDGSDDCTDSKNWQYPAYGDVDLRAPYAGALIETDDMNVSLCAPRANEVTFTLTLNVEEKDEIAGSVINLATSDAAEFGRDVILTAAGAAEEAMNHRASDAVIDQAIADLEAELERDGDG